jgi:hypothetical protein
MSRWETGTKETRETAKWVVATAGAAGAVIFGAGPILARADLTGDHIPLRVFALLLSAAVGVTGLAYIIGQTARVLLPFEVTLAELPTSLLAKITASPSAYLPSDAPDVLAFREGMSTWDLAARELRDQSAQRQDELKELLASSPPDVDSISRLRTETDLYETYARIASENLAIYKAARDDLLDQAAYTETRRLYAGNWWKLYAAGLAIVLGAVCYLLLLGADPAKDDSDADSTPAPRVGQLVMSETAAAVELWEAADLNGCQSTATSGAVFVDVVVESGHGSVNSPYAVRTLGPDTEHPQCRRVSFNVIDDVARVVVPDVDEKLEITYSQGEPTETTAATNSSSPDTSTAESATSSAPEGT